MFKRAEHNTGLEPTSSKSSYLTSTGHLDLVTNGLKRAFWKLTGT